MSSQSTLESCRICQNIPDYSEDSKRLQFTPKLKRLKGRGEYYRGEEYQLSVFTLLQCPQCGTYYEETHHYYSDPQSIMGMVRDEDDWYALERLSDEMAITRLKQIKKD